VIPSLHTPPISVEPAFVGGIFFSRTDFANAQLCWALWHFSGRGGLQKPPTCILRYLPKSIAAKDWQDTAAFAEIEKGAHLSIKRLIPFQVTAISADIAAQTPSVQRSPCLFLVNISMPILLGICLLLTGVCLLFAGDIFSAASSVVKSP